MTQPIQEPSDSRKFSKLTYGQDQLFRRPAPSGGENVWPYVWRGRDTNQTIEAGSIEFIDWDNDDFTQADGHFTAGDNFSFNIIGPGVFDFLCGAHWDSQFNAGTGLRCDCDAFGWFPSIYWKPLYDGATPLTGDDAFFIHFTARLPSGTSATAWSLGHESATDKDISAAFMRVAYIADYVDGSTDQPDFAFL